MRITAKVKLNKADAYCNEYVTLTSGMQGAKCKFIFSEEWNEYPKKTAKFIIGSQNEQIEIENDTVEIPSSLLSVPRKELKCGVVGENPTLHKVLPSTIVKIGIVMEGVSI